MGWHGTENVWKGGYWVLVLHIIIVRDEVYVCMYAAGKGKIRGEGR